MVQAVKFDNKILFEIETIDGVKYLKKQDKIASRRAGKPVFARIPLAEILQSDKETIHIK